MKKWFSLLLLLSISLCIVPFAALAGIPIEVDDVDPPTNFAATADAIRQVTLSWTGVSYATDYTIERTDGGFSTTASKTDTQVTDGSVEPGQSYTYKIKTHYHDSGTSTDYYSAEVTVTVTASLPDAPTNLKAKADSSGTSVTLTWDAADSADSYNVYRDGTLIASGIAGTTYTDSGISAGSQYTYEVETVIGSATSSTKASVVYSAEEPGKVQNLHVEDAKTTSLKLVWEAPTDGGTPDYYQMELSKNSNFSSPVTRQTSNLYYNVSGLECGTTYYYRVRAHVAGSTSEYGVWESTSYRTTPNAPASLTAVQVTGTADNIKLTWPQETTASGYIITRRLSTETVFSEITTLTSSTILTYTDKTVTAGNTYVYRIHSYYTLSDGQTRVVSDNYAESNSVELKVPVPTNVKAESAGNSSIKLSWDKVSGAVSYIIMRNESGSFVELARTADTSYTDSNGIVFGKDYTYTVQAYVSDDAVSDPCTPVIGHAVGPVPTNVKATYASSSSIKVTWNAVSNARGYKVEGSDTKTGTYTQLYEGTDLFYTETGLSIGQARYYKVTAYVNISGNKVYGTPSDVVWDVTRPVAPTVNVENTDYNKQKVSWNDLGGSSVKYEMQLSTDAAFSSPLTRNTSNLYYNVTGCVSGTVYYYRVRGFVTVGGVNYYGPYSTVKSKTSAPAEPSSVTATVTEYNKVKVTWPAVNGATGYQLSMSEDTAAWKVLKTVDVTTTSYTVTGLKVGSHYFFGIRALRNVNGKDAVGDMTKSNEVEISINNYIPKKFTETAIDTTSIKIGWESMPGLSTWQVRVTSDDDSNFATPQTYDVSTNSVTLTGLIAGYNYKVEVRARATINNQIVYSNWSAVHNTSPKTVAPTGLKLTSAYKAYAISADWTQSQSCDGYILERSATKDSGFTQIADINRKETVHYGDYNYTSADAGKTFYYRICSYVNSPDNVKIKSAYTTPVGVLLNIPKPELTVSPQNKGRINLSWTDWGADKYQIFRSTKKDSGYIVIKTVTGTSYSDTDVSFGTTYYYKVNGLKTVGTVTVSGYQSDVQSGEPKTVAPTMVSVTPNGASVVVKWNKAAGATGYKVFYCEEGADWKTAGTTTSLSYTVKGLKCNTKYNFKVAGTAKASNGKTVEGLHSGILSTTTKLGKPSGMSFNSNGINSVVLNWNKVTDATGYQIQFATYNASDGSQGSWHDKMTVTTNKATVTGLLKNKMYWFRLRAYITKDGVTNYGDWSSAFKAFSAPKAPTNVKAVGTTKNNITLSWTAPAGAEGYRIWYKKKGDASFTIWGLVTGGNTTSHVITGLSANTTYVFRIQAYGKETTTLYLWGPRSGEFSGTTKK